jgi:methylated-DNA-[protein]-cysteine S-methyltransferase
MSRLVIDTPLGKLALTGTDNALTGLTLRPDREDSAPNPFLEHAAEEIREYFAGSRRTFDLPLAPEGTEFQKKVWDALCAIPYGETRSYGRIAADVGNPRAARAVGMACNRNPIGIIIPCHRVVGANGALTGYFGGLPLKAALLRLESGE